MYTEEINVISKKVRKFFCIYITRKLESLIENQFCCNFLKVQFRNQFLKLKSSKNFFTLDSRRWHFRLKLHWALISLEGSIDRADVLLLELVCCLRSWVKKFPLLEATIVDVFWVCLAAVCWVGGWWRLWSKLRWLETVASRVLLLMSILSDKRVLRSMITNLTAKGNFWLKISCLFTNWQSKFVWLLFELNKEEFIAPPQENFQKVLR